MNTQEFIRECIAKLGLSQDIRVIPIVNDYHLDKFSIAGYELEALLHKTAVPHTYALYIRTGKSLDWNILAHEMIHLEQYERGDLAIDQTTGAVTWKGMAYGNSMEYMSRPWEIEAFSRQKELTKSEEAPAKPKAAKTKVPKKAK